MRLAYLTVVNISAGLGLLLASDRDKDTEILVLRHQVGVLGRRLGGEKARFTLADRTLLAALLQWPSCGSTRTSTTRTGRTAP